MTQCSFGCERHRSETCMVFLPLQEGGGCGSGDEPGSSCLIHTQYKDQSHKSVTSLCFGYNIITDTLIAMALPRPSRCQQKQHFLLPNTKSCCCFTGSYGNWCQSRSPLPLVHLSFSPSYILFRKTISEQALSSVLARELPKYCFTCSRSAPIRWSLGWQRVLHMLGPYGTRPLPPLVT